MFGLIAADGFQGDVEGDGVTVSHRGTCMVMTFHRDDDVLVDIGGKTVRFRKEEYERVMRKANEYALGALYDIVKAGT